MARQDKPSILGGPKARTRPFAPHPILGKEERVEVLSVLKTGLLSGFIAKPGEAFLGGPKVKKLENLFSAYFGTKHAVAMNSATSALHAALFAVGVEPGDEVIVPPYTMSASASAVVMCGGIPVFSDIEEDHYCLDPGKIEDRIGPRTKAILVVHLFGGAAQMDEILRIAKRHKLAVVEDCAQAPGAIYKGKPVGTLGDVGIYSFNQHKTVTTGEGGVAVTNDARVAVKMQLVRNHGEVVADHMPEAKDIPVLGWNYRMTELEGAIGCAQFKKLDGLTQHRAALAVHLTKKLSGLPGLALPRARKGATHVYFTYPVRFDAAKAGLSRDQLMKALAAEGIPAGAGYVRPIYLEPMYRDRRIFERSSWPFDLQNGKNLGNYAKGSCPIAERLHEKELIMTGVCRYPLTKGDMDDVARAFEKILTHAAEIRKAL